MSHLPKVLNALSRLLSYPDEHTVQTAELLYVVLLGESDAAARLAMQFGQFAEQHPLAEIEEAFTRTFDVNPASALEVGWHLFGEEYARGMFLVRMREELRKYGLPESVELPDHLSHVLALMAAMPDDEAERFVRMCVQPAVEIMSQGLQDQDTPYRDVVACLAAVLEHVWGPRQSSSGSAPQQTPFQSDPLHAEFSFPANADCGPECGHCSEPHLLEIQLPGSQAPALESPSPVKKP